MVWYDVVLIQYAIAKQKVILDPQLLTTNKLFGVQALASYYYYY